MTRFLAPVLALLFATAAHAQSGLVPANQVWAGPPSGGEGFARARALVSADLPALSFGSFSLASGLIAVGQASGFAGAVAMSGDCTIVASGAVTCTKTGGVAFTALATTAPGTGVASALGTAVGSAGAVVVNGGTIGTPSSGVGTNLTALNASNLASGTVPAARLPVYARSTVAGASPGVGSATTVMAGIGLVITPTASGNVLVQFNLTGSNSAGSTGCSAQIAWGTGAAPAHNAAASGTTIGSLVAPTTGTATTVFAIPLSAYITGRTLSTAIWVDVQYSQNGGGTCTLGAFNGWAAEQ